MHWSVHFASLVQYLRAQLGANLDETASVELNEELVEMNELRAPEPVVTVGTPKTDARPSMDAFVLGGEGMMGNISYISNPFVLNLIFDCLSAIWLTFFVYVIYRNGIIATASVAYCAYNGQLGEMLHRTERTLYWETQIPIGDGGCSKRELV